LDALILQYKQAEYNKFNKTKTNLDAIRGLIKTVRGYVYGWKQKYNLVAMKAGKVNFLQRIQVGSFLKGGEELFAITDSGGSYMGIAKVPTSGYGKLKVGQEVNILVENYPYYEYGILKGKVQNIALFPNTNEYRVEIDLPNGMNSSQQYTMNFTPEMSGEAEIITDNKRILERLFESVAKALKRK
jgi:HlyD family secretion protein